MRHRTKILVSARNNRAETFIMLIFRYCQIDRLPYHLYPQFLHSNCDLAVVLNNPHAAACTPLRSSDIFLMFVELQVGQRGVASLGCLQYINLDLQAGHLET